MYFGYFAVLACTVFQLGAAQLFHGPCTGLAQEQSGSKGYGKAIVSPNRVSIPRVVARGPEGYLHVADGFSLPVTLRVHYVDDGPEMVKVHLWVENFENNSIVAEIGVYSDLRHDPLLVFRVPAKEHGGIGLQCVVLNKAFLQMPITLQAYLG